MARRFEGRVFRICAVLAFGAAMVRAAFAVGHFICASMTIPEASDSVRATAARIGACDFIDLPIGAHMCSLNQMCGKRTIGAMFDQVSVEAPPSRLRTIGQMLPRIGLALFFAAVGYTKFNSDPSGEWYQIFERIGVGQWLRHVTGVMQVGGAVLLLSRRTLTVGAAMLACTMAGAAFVDLFIMPSPIVIVPLLLLMIVIVVWLTA